MTKDSTITIRLTGTLKERYMNALAFHSEEIGTEYSQTDHLTQEIVKFVEATKKKQKQKTAP